MNFENKNRAIVVLGAGRTGTSLLTNILVILGMEVSNSLIPSSEQNPKGFFEDDAIVNINKSILSTLGYHGYIPFDQSLLNNKSINNLSSELGEILTNNVKASRTIWGFKDPRTPALLPLWIRVFNTAKVNPVYVLAVRNPAHAITSMKKQYNNPPLLSELAWLHRNCEALYHTGGNCFIVHYEDWFSDESMLTAQQLAEYAGLDEHIEDKVSLKDKLSEVVAPNLNRAVYNDYSICNRYVEKLYNQLQTCKGDQFDREALMSIVMECRKAMKEFSGWSNEAQRLFHSSRSTKNKETPMAQQLDTLNKYNNLKIKESITNKQLHKSKLEMNNKIEKAEQKTVLLQNSVSYQTGNAIVKAFTKPGRNTFLLPFYLVRLLFSHHVLK